tara:strand:- start:824 stop:1333 length:510 start_codon:yes stop_codon:yes gene_type:complete
MLCLFNNTKEECPICLQEKKLTTQCKICTDTRICKDCCISLCEKGLCGKCPVCRQPNWKKPKKTQIIPISKINLLPKESKVINGIILENQNNMDKCKYMLLNLVVCISLSLLIYAIGMFTLLIFTTKEDWDSYSALYWLSPIIGLVWLLLIWSPCCCGKNLNKIFCKKY